MATPGWDNRRCVAREIRCLEVVPGHRLDSGPNLKKKHMRQMFDDMIWTQIWWCEGGMRGKGADKNQGDVVEVRGNGRRRRGEADRRR